MKGRSGKKVPVCLGGEMSLTCLGTTSAMEAALPSAPSVASLLRYRDSVRLGGSHWWWTGSTDRAGLPMLPPDNSCAPINGLDLGWWCEYGTWPPSGFLVRQVCGIGRCVRPDHLVLASADARSVANLGDESMPTRASLRICDTGERTGEAATRSERVYSNDQTPRGR